MPEDGGERNSSSRLPLSEDEIRAKKYDPQLFLENARNFQLTKVPCAKDSLFQGALGGATVGVVRFIRTKYIGSAVSWSIGGFVASSLISLEICRRTRENHEAKLREAKQAMQQFRETQSGKQLPYSQDRGISHE
ncbi:hypothetical protein PTSG_11109 [Salpingoeca rosetta]|uniref:Cytochrome c oxidase assembly protein COX20, mitochondrial n=1 Tax=Salpingoeca rosetta (strain ATCC 50818 / BSB-021) TaxID=946362 RepID=F2US60_SALR5|nr:uncharacterized protein PTSG_11109 [Salpingoeca rosetta]EGD80465.1 hypothetical protein PTSG_11109 [Salpingoeca rosetta]|eukprot:XP_004988029.1 hypothetical protein PTSG_11109 [Salpingoeca rosetta]